MHDSEVVVERVVSVLDSGGSVATSLVSGAEYGDAGERLVHASPEPVEIKVSLEPDDGPDLMVVGHLLEPDVLVQGLDSEVAHAPPLARMRQQAP